MVVVVTSLAAVRTKDSACQFVSVQDTPKHDAKPYTEAKP